MIQKGSSSATVPEMAEMASDFNYSVVFNFEKNFDEPAFLEWISQNWTHSFWYSAIYMILVYSGRRYMEKRPRFEIRWALFMWSAILGVFSIFGAVRTIPELVYVLKNYGFEFSVCNPSYFHGPTVFWAFTFTISKAYELGDTAFIVLRKQPLIFLHWYHHVTVLIYVWYSYTDHTAPGRWFMAMNYTVHAFMYTYYALKALRINIPKSVSMCITTMQISQMIVGTYINLWTYNHKSQGNFCQQSFENLRYSLLMYFSYFLLFAYFFYSAYFTSAKKRARQYVPPDTDFVKGKKLF